jgi:branched-subunit amino acid ABC-type transport system permease component
MPSFYTQTFAIGKVQISLLQIIVLLTVAVLVGLLQLLITKPKSGWPCVRFRKIIVWPD